MIDSLIGLVATFGAVYLTPNYFVQVTYPEDKSVFSITIFRSDGVYSTMLNSGDSIIYSRIRFSKKEEYLKSAEFEAKEIGDIFRVKALRDQRSFYVEPIFVPYRELLYTLKSQKNFGGEDFWVLPNLYKPEPYLLFCGEVATKRQMLGHVNHKTGNWIEIEPELTFDPNIVLPNYLKEMINMLPEID